jgi:hypothetical protein
MKPSLLLLISASIGLAEEPDIPGWNKASWGMTQEEVMRELPESRIHPPDEYRSKPFLAIPHYSIGARTYMISFAFDETGKLFRVEVSLEAPGGIAAEGAKSELLDLLTDKYGAASGSGTERERGALTHRWEWIRTHGRITLSYYEYPDWKSSFMGLAYYQRKQSDAI